MDVAVGLVQILAQVRGKFRRETDLHRAAIRLLMMKRHHYPISWFHEESLPCIAPSQRNGYGQKRPLRRPTELAS